MLENAKFILCISVFVLGFIGFFLLNLPVSTREIKFVFLKFENSTQKTSVNCTAILSGKRAEIRSAERYLRLDTFKFGAKKEPFSCDKLLIPEYPETKSGAVRQ